MTNKSFIIALVSIITIGTVSAGAILYAGNNKTVTQVEQTAETNPIQELEIKETWQKVSKNLYFDTATINIQSDYIEGTFKQYNHDNEKQDGKIYAYKTIWTGAFCDIKLQDRVKKLEFPIYKYYDFNGKLLSENNIHKTWAENYPDGHLGITHSEDVENGNIYFKTLCKYFK